MAESRRMPRASKRALAASKRTAASLRRPSACSAAPSTRPAMPSAGSIPTRSSLPRRQPGPGQATAVDAATTVARPSAARARRLRRSTRWNWTRERWLRRTMCHARITWAHAARAPLVQVDVGERVGRAHVLKAGERLRALAQCQRHAVRSRLRPESSAASETKCRGLSVSVATAWRSPRARADAWSSGSRAAIFLKSPRRHMAQSANACAETSSHATPVPSRTSVASARPHDSTQRSKFQSPIAAAPQK